MATTGHVDNLTIGRGEVYFDRFAPNSQTPTGLRYLGNTPGLSLSIAAEKIKHFSSDRGLREQDASIVLETTRSGSLSCDNINFDNLALFFFGTSSVVTQTAIGSAVTEDITVEAGKFYRIGVTSGRPTGLRNVTLGSVVTTSPSATAVLNTDYKIDAEQGMLEILPGSFFVAGTPKLVRLSYTAAASTRKQMISGANPVQGAITVISYNPIGDKVDYYMPNVELTPAGEYALKGEDWQTMEFSIEASVKGALAAIYADGRPVV